MAPSGKEASFVKAKRMKGFISHLTSAACEWFLIFLLLLDALLSYMLTKFASYCRLQLPCLLCSRLDHILGRERPEFYDNLFCSNHKSEISSLVLCHIHGKLANGHKMCDDCLLSVNAKTKTNGKSHRLLVGKFGLALGDSGFKSPSLSRDLFAGSKGSRLCTRQCTCCGKLWKSDPNSPRSIQLKSSGRAVLKPYIPLPCAPRQSRLNHRDNMRKMRDKFGGLEGKNSFQPLSHVGYCELRLTSDSENEFPFSDDDDFSNSSVFQENIEDSNDRMAQITLPPPIKSIPSNSNLENGSSAKPMPLSSDQCMEPNVGKHQGVNANSAVEINLQQTKQESFSSELAELISLDEVSPSPTVRNVSNRESEPEDSKITFPSQDSLPAPLSELMTLNGTNALAGASSEKSADVAQASDMGMVSEKNGEVLEKIGREEKTSTETVPVVCDSAPTNPSQENSSNMNKFSVVTKERKETEFVIKQPTTEEVNTIKEEVERSPLDNSAPNGSNLSSPFPINHVDSPEMHTEDSSSNGIQELKKSSSVESGLESLDESNIGEIEGECYADRLRRHIHYYKQCLDSLHKELEEERNASAVATNEAMSMITRLQEEKAALQMEALQYLRMMEEQAEYDKDELDKVNDLLTEKEKELQDLEAELEFYRSSMPNVEPMVHNMHKESWDLRGEKATTQNTGVPNILRKFSSSKNLEVSRVGDEAKTGGTFILEFEEEKEYISQCLKNLEQRVYQISLHAPNDRHEKLEVSSKSNQQGASNVEGHQLDGHEETDLSTQKNTKMLNGNHIDKDGSAVENNHSTSPGPTISTPRRDFELVVLENEILDLNDRLEALELNHELLEHLTNSLNTNDGKLFIQDIARRLRELRKIGIR
ncbi:myosin-binding protein 1 [Vigna radiata var. radiata]|uniref:Myosin-binding protein 1 n=1 Tax=Vigna radiata var. radiata TaxID=3916 RepID=A0A1S3UXS0_VIGRR|nr:myosin-binding protein 1 [Vigna radiata var. radiata]XP_014510845.1 myosin-binding protein 1 [Vigna radiata var. radiata]